MIFKLAWRNIWRNKRRTFITAASILFAVLFASFMDSLQEGAWNNTIKNSVNFYYGYMQIHQKGYWEEQSLERAFPITDSIERIAEIIPGVTGIVPRIESFALASTGENTMGVLVLGIDPEQENELTKLASRLVEGEYLDKEDKEVMIAEGVGEKLNLSIGDTLLMISQGYHGVNAAGKYPVKGIISFPTPELNKQLVYLPIREAQWFYGAEQMATSLALKMNSEKAVDPALTALTQRLDTTYYEVMDWKAMMPDLLEAKALDSAGNKIVYIILYMIIAFGIFGTILMMTKERSYEFGVLTAIGMQRHSLWLTVWLEVVILGVIGAVAGILVSIPIVLYFKFNPIRFSGDYAATMEKFGFEPVFPTHFDMTIFLTQALLILIVTGLLALYPMLKINQLQPVEAMRE